MISVIIPAHNESNVLGRCLTSLTAGGAPGELEVIVVANGCTDDSAQIAREFGDSVRVVEIPVASKTAALNAGDREAHGFPRFYVDADVVLSLDSLRRLATRLGRNDVLAVSPQIQLNPVSCSWAVQAFYEVDRRMPSHRETIGGSGVYGLSERGRKRFNRFPTSTADDAFVRCQFQPHERVAVEDSVSLVTVPITLSGLIAIKTRSHFGNYELARRYPKLRPQMRSGNHRALLRLVLRPSVWPQLGIYLYVKARAKLRARWWLLQGQQLGWPRDESSRVSRVTEVLPERFTGDTHATDVERSAKSHPSRVCLITVIIPAHNEADVIHRTLSAFMTGAASRDVEVIVVCNGCTDETADVARAFGGNVRVLETDQPSKAHALNLGDRAARGFPRFYLDADVMLDLASLRRVADVLTSGQALAAAPRPELELSGSSWPVRAYYAIDRQLPWFREGIGNSGVYGLSEAGRGRFTEFPHITTDDSFVRLQYQPYERVTVADAISRVIAPATLRSLIVIKTRSHFSKWEIRSHFPELRVNDAAPNRPVLLRLALRPHNWPGLAVYTYVKVIARIRCRLKYRLGRSNPWERDHSSRLAPHGTAESRVTDAMADELEPSDRIGVH